MSAAEIESHVCNAVRRHLEPVDDIRSFVATHVARVDVKPDELVITFADSSPANGKAKKPGSSKPSIERDDARISEVVSATTLAVAWKKIGQTRHRELITAERQPGDRRIRAETRARLIEAIARGRCWLEELKSGSASDLAAIALRERCSKRHVSMTISLAFLAPSLVTAAVQGRLPDGIGVARLIDAPVEWSRQYQVLGLEP